MKKTLALFLALLMIFALFAGCGKKEEAKDTGKAASGSGTSSSAKPAAQSGNTIEINQIGTTAEDTKWGTSGADVKAVEVHPSDTATIRFTFNEEPLGLTMPGVAFAKAYNQAHIFSDCLVKWDSNLNDIVPNVAKSWEWIDDLTLRMYLEENVKSHAGDPLTASDVIFTFKTSGAITANSQYFEMFDFDKCKAVDDYTVDLVVKAPYPYLVQDLANYGAYALLVEKTYNAIGGAEGAKEDPSAMTGPYKLVKWVPSVCVYAERNEDYWGIKPYYKYVEEYNVPDTNARAMGIEAGDYDVDPQASSNEVLAAADNPKVKGWSLNSVGAYSALSLNSDTEPLNVKECRQAISLAIDREALKKIVLSDLGTVTDSVYGPLHPAYQPWSGKGENNYRFDLEAAKQKLIDAGYPDVFTITCKYRNSAYINSAAEMLHNMLGQVGIELELMMQESATWYSDMRSGNWNTNLATGGNPNPKRIMSAVNPLSTHNEVTGSAGANWDETGTVPELITKCLTTVDETERNGYLSEFQDICREYVPIIVLFSRATTVLANPKIEFVGLDIMGTLEYTTPYEAEYLG